MAKEIPVYLFTGFLEAGKTKFIQHTLQDDSFNTPGDRILLLLCEEGPEEYDPTLFAAPDVYLERVEREGELTPLHLTALLREHRCDYVMVEYNGMWMLDSLYNNLPAGWTVAQEFLFLDAGTFLRYDANMRQLMVDKLKSCELAVLNRFPEGDGELKLQAHKIIRAVNRRCDIAFETAAGETSYDDIQLPLPYDLSAPVAVVQDADYAIFLQDISEQPEKYQGKTVQVKGRAVTKSRALKPGYFLLGRDVMTCCANDVRFIPVVAETKDTKKLQNLGWYTVTARVELRSLPQLYEGVGPVLHVLSAEPAAMPAREIATFY